MLARKKHAGSIRSANFRFQRNTHRNRVDGGARGGGEGGGTKKNDTLELWNKNKKRGIVHVKAIRLDVTARKK